MIEGLLRKELKIKKLSFFDLTGEWDFDVYVQGNKLIFVDKDGDVELLTIDRDYNDIKAEHLVVSSIGIDDLSNDIEFLIDKIQFNKPLNADFFMLFTENSGKTSVLKLIGNGDTVNPTSTIRLYNLSSSKYWDFSWDYSYSTTNFFTVRFNGDLVLRLQKQTVGKSVLTLVSKDYNSYIEISGLSAEGIYSGIRLIQDNTGYKWLIAHSSDYTNELVFQYYSDNWDYKMRLTTTGDLYIKGSYLTFSPKLPTLAEVLKNPEIAYEEIYNIAKIPSSEGKLKHLDEKLKRLVLEKAFKKDISKTALLNARLIIWIYRKIKEQEEKIKNLESENEMLKSQIHQLEEKLQEIEERLSKLETLEYGGENK